MSEAEAQLKQVEHELMELKTRYSRLVAAGKNMREKKAAYFNPATRNGTTLNASKQAEYNFDLLVGLKEPNNQTNLF